MIFELGNTASNVMALQLLSMLCTPFTDFPAYKTGVIDEKGNYLVPPSKRTLEQRKSIGYLDRLIINVKKIINKTGNENKLKNIIVGMFLVKENLERYRTQNILLEEDNHVSDPIKEDLWALKDTRDRYQASRNQTLELWSEYVRLKENVGVSAMSGGASGNTPTNNLSGIAWYDLPLGSIARRKKEVE